MERRIDGEMMGRLIDGRYMDRLVVYKIGSYPAVFILSGHGQVRVHGERHHDGRLP